MQFERLRLAGFKSFVDATELRIEPGLTGVVGPNGCGKSNLLEAFRWVMGEGSPKSLRGGGMDDVIFAGTAQRPGRDFAEVMLTLGDTGAAAGDDPLQVVRRVERGLGSAYRINGRDVRARDVALLFADAATGAHSPALVSQGRIGAIIAAKPAERRALLEEAAGISGLHVRRHEAELRLKATEANLLRLDDVIAADAAAAAALRRAAKAAERYRALSDALQAAERSLVFTRWAEAQAAATAAADAAAAAEAAVVAASDAATARGAAQAQAAAALPGLRDAAAAAAAAMRSLADRERELAAAAAAVALRQRDLATAAALLDRDRSREAALAGDAADADARLGDEATRLDAVVAAAAPALAAAEADVAAAERAAQVGEIELGAALEAHARAAASARAAAAARDAAAARLARAEAEATRLAAVPLPDLAALDARRDAAGAAAAAAAQAIATATAAIATAEAARRDGEVARDAAHARLLAARAAAAALAAERDAVRRLLAAAPAGSLIDSVAVAPGNEQAFAAAFGDDLAATIGGDTGRFWEVVDGDLPPLPPGVAPLRATVPAALARRLAATGVATADVAAAAPLQPGQQVVTRDGRLWRWDGFRDLGGGQGIAVAERLTQHNRLAAAEAALPDATAVVDAAKSELDATGAALAAAVAADGEARAARAAAERDHDRARTALATATSERDRAAALREANAAAIARLRGDAAALADEVGAAHAALAAAGDVPALAAAVAAARGSAEAARARLAQARATAAGLSRDRDAAAARRAAIDGERAAWARRVVEADVRLADLDRRAAATAAELADLERRPAAIAQDRAALAEELATATAANAAATAALADGERRLAAFDAEAAAAAEALSLAREARAAAAADAGHARERCREIEVACGERFAASPPALGAARGDAASLAADVARLAAERERIGPVNLRADLELAELTAAADRRSAERAELETAVARLRGSIGALNREGRTRLLAAFATVNGHFRALFDTLFAGGAAHLELVELDDPLTAGLEIMAQPPGKKLQSLTLLSGGEQALTAAALIFALFLTTPSPLCVLDEVDAPLDDANVERFCDLLDRMARETRTRFLIVTHNAVTMSRMHRLYGVTMAEPGVSQLVSVDLQAAERLLAAE